MSSSCAEEENQQALTLPVECYAQSNGEVATFEREFSMPDLNSSEHSQGGAQRRVRRMNVMDEERNAMLPSTPQWSCNACTYVNEDNLTRCELCREKRPEMKAAKVSLESTHEGQDRFKKGHDAAGSSAKKRHRILQESSEEDEFDKLDGDEYDSLNAVSEKDDWMESEEEEEDAPKKIKKRAVVRKITVARADINGKGSVKADKGGRGKKKRASFDSDSDDFELGPDADNEDESIAADSESDFRNTNSTYYNQEISSQPSMSIANYCKRVSQGETFGTTFERAVQSKLVDDERSVRLIQEVMNFRKTPSPIVPADHEFADEILKKAGEKLKDGTYLTCTKDPAAYARNETNGHSIISSWSLPESSCNVTESSEMNAVEMTKTLFTRHAQCDDIGQDRIRVAETGKFQMLDAIASSDGNPNSPPPAVCDVIPGHKHTGKNHDAKPGTIAIESGESIGKLMLRHLLARSRTVSVDGKSTIDALAEVINSDVDLTLTLLSDNQLVEMCPIYYPMRRENGMLNHNAMIVFDNKTNNVCFVATSYQLASILSGPWNCAISNQLIPNATNWKALMFYIHGSIGAENVFPGRQMRYDESALYQAKTIPGCLFLTKIFIHERLMPAEGVTILTSNQVGGIKSHATDPGCEKGVHWMTEKGRNSVSTLERGIASHATDPGCEKGEHWMVKEGRNSVSTLERGIASHATDPGCEKGEHWMVKEGRYSKSMSARSRESLGSQNIDEPFMLLQLLSSKKPDATPVSKFSRNQADIVDVLLMNQFFKKPDGGSRKRVGEYKEKARVSENNSHRFTTRKQYYNAPRASDWWKLSLHESVESIRKIAQEAEEVTTKDREVSASYRKGHK